ncbi:hypothetical protein [Rhizorhabdus histidinilytica]|uniref:hypothetical protein n=1 Tax=Rhizorhabdus histidinilytica TaxID=439228 RepID=UPI00322071DC
MREVILAAAMVGLTSCTTAAIADRSPLVSFTSQRSVAEIATCLSTALNKRRAAVRTEQSPTGVILAISVPVAGFSSVLDTISIDDTGNERRVVLRSKAAKAPSEDRLNQLFHPCL